MASSRRMMTSSPPPAEMRPPSPEPELELQESEVWYGRRRSQSPELGGQAAATTAAGRRGVPVRTTGRTAAAAAASLPVRIPDWSKILKQEYRERGRGGEEEEEEEGEMEGVEGRRLPPHEYLARTRMASQSVHEGMGRTLKGRDLWRVRDAVWEKTGFLN